MISYDDLTQAFQARHLAVLMEDALAFSPATPVAEAHQQLSADNYDQAPVLDGGRILGFVLTRRLEDAPAGSTVAEFQTPIGPGNIVSADAPVSRLLHWIVEPGFLFVLDGREVAGFVTVSDFNKQPARAYLYLLLTTFEIALADMARRRFGPEQRG